MQYPTVLGTFYAILVSNSKNILEMEKVQEV